MHVFGCFGCVHVCMCACVSTGFANTHTAHKLYLQNTCMLLDGLIEQ